MKILFITAFVPSKKAAGENFSRQIINDLAKKNQIGLIMHKYKSDESYICESENVNVIKVFKNSFLIKLINFALFPFLFPLFVSRFNIFRLYYIKRVIKEGGYDLLFFDYSQTHLYARFIKNKPIILNTHDVIYQRYSRIYGGLLKSFCKVSERYLLKNNKIFTVSLKDKELIKELYNIDASVENIHIDEMVRVSIPTHLSGEFVFFANWRRDDNSKGLYWFVKYVYPKIPYQVKIKIIGGGLSGKLKDIISECSSIEYLGFVENPYPIISNAKALLSPLFSGAGIKVKVLESLACGTHVIGTNISLEGIPKEFEDYIISANSADDFILEMQNINVSINGKKLIKKHFLGNYQNGNITKYVNNEF